MQVKADFHAHTDIDPLDILDYSPYDYINWAKKQGYKVIAMTHHEKLIYPKKVVAYAKKKGIVMIPGFEATVEGQHVVVLNPTTDKISTWKQLAEEKKRGQCYIILPHPFWSLKNIRTKCLEKRAHLFDAVEECWLQTPWFTYPNRLAHEYATRHKLPIVNTGDIHKLEWAGTSYTMLDVKELSVAGALEALRSRKIKPVQKNVKSGLFIYLIFRYIISGPIYHRGQWMGRLIEKWRKRKSSTSGRS